MAWPSRLRRPAADERLNFRVRKGSTSLAASGLHGFFLKFVFWLALILTFSPRRRNRFRLSLVFRKFPERPPTRDIPNQRRTILPLPRGEGRGEGELELHLRSYGSALDSVGTGA
jgi:hypothetical protein